MTKAARKRYIQSAGTDGCPYCKADMEQFDYGEMDPVEDGSVEQKVKCLQCKRVWMDVFLLKEVRELCCW
jgi:hypothetical protein